MKQIVFLIAILSSFAMARQGAQESAVMDVLHRDLNANRAGIAQVYDIVHQFGQVINEIPPQIERIAVYRIRVSQRDFSPGMARFIKGKLEETLIKTGRRKVVTSPELKTIRIASTDTTFMMTNTVPTLDDLWDLGNKLKVDAFLDGTCTRSEDGDVLVHLRLIRQNTAEIIWSSSFVAGPNKQKQFVSDVRYTMGAGFGLLPVKTLDFVEKKMDMYHHYLLFQVGEAATPTRSVNLSFFTGIGWMLGVGKDGYDSTIQKLPTVYPIQVGAELTTVLFPKNISEAGYWGALYFGGKFFVFQRMLMLSGGYRAEFSKHLEIKTGVNYLPINKVLYVNKQLLFSDTRPHEVLLEDLSYEINILFNF
jgi:hypothetical protein